MGQGKDIVISFTENTRKGEGFSVVLVNLLIKFTLFMAIAFWAYVSWYSSRIVAYAKLYRQKTYASQFKPALPEKDFVTVYEVQKLFLDIFPRLVGYACFIIILFAVSNVIYPDSWVKQQPMPCLAVLLLVTGLIDKRLIRFTDNESSSKRLRRWFNITGIGFLVLLLVLQISGLLNHASVLFFMIILLMIIYMLYINLRRKIVAEDAGNLEASPRKENALNRLLKKIMAFIHLDPKEIGYFLWFNIICGIGLLAYLLAIYFFKVSVAFGPLPLVLLAFSVLLGFGNVITILSVKTGINLHFIAFVIAAIFPNLENHFVRTAPSQTSLGATQRRPLTNQPSLNDKPGGSPAITAHGNFKNRQNIQEYFNAWVTQHSAIDSVPEYPMYFVLGNGGASRSAYRVASVLGKLEDNSIRAGKDRFSEHVFCLSGTSGGGVGVAAFYSMLKYANKQDRTTGFEIAAKNYLRQDFLTYTLARMLGPDYFNYIPVLNWLVPNPDRVDALESAFEQADDKEYYKLHWDSTWFDQCITQKNSYNGMPVLCINTTRVQDGNPGVLSSIQLDPRLFNRRVDVVNLLRPDTTIRLSTAAILGARFPYMSPAGRIDQPTHKRRSSADKKDSTISHFFVDGGYFDNSGAGIVQEMIRAIIKVSDTTRDALLRQRMKKLKIIVLHITNSPQGDSRIKPVTPFKNDLISPLLTVLGAYDMQTTVNDMRLINYTADVDLRPDSVAINKALYYPIHLYSDPTEPGDRSVGPYAMNWFISDSVRNQMDRRLISQPKLKRMMAGQ